MKFDFYETDTATVKDTISFRINKMQELNKLVIQKIDEISDLIQIKNKDLLNEIKAGTQQEESQGSAVKKINTSVW